MVDRPRDGGGKFIPLGDMQVRLTADSTVFEKMIASAEKKLTAAADRLQAAGAKMTAAVTIPLTALGAASVKAFADFDDAMTKSVSIMGKVSAEQRKELEDTARSISRSTATSAAKLAEGLQFLASAGLDVKQSMTALPVVERFATAGAFDLARATELLADSQSALGLASKDATQHMQNMVRVSDVLVQAGNISNGSQEQFATALTNKAGAALRLLNKDLEEGVAVLAAFADQGVKGESAGTALQIVLRDLQVAALGQPEAWSAFGMAVYDASGKMLPIADIVGQLESRFTKMSDAQKKQAAEMLGFQERSFASMQQLMGSSQKIREYEKALRSAGGATQEVANVQMQSFSSQMAILKNNVVDVGISIGQVLVPWIQKLTVYVQEATAWWRALDVETQKFLVLGLALVAVIGPGLLLIGKVVAFIVGLFTGWVGIIMLVGTAVALVTDMVLQMTGKGNLGILDMINNFRIGGYKIATWMTATWLMVFQSFDWVKTKILQGWEAMKLAGAELSNFLEKTFLKAARTVVNALLKIADAMTFGLMGKKIDELQKQADQHFDKKDSARRASLLEAHASAAKNTFGLEGAHEKQKAIYESAIRDVFAEDLKTQEKTVAEKTVMPTLPGMTLPNVTLPSMDKFELPKLPSESKAAGAGRQDASFSTVSLRRFALDGPGGLSRPTAKQEVRAQGVESRLDTLIDLERNKNSNVAVLG